MLSMMYRTSGELATGECFWLNLLGIINTHKSNHNNMMT